MTAPSHADIIDKLQKLRILAHNKAAMPGETEAALRAMSALMARYRITEAELEKAGREHSTIHETDDLWPPAKHIPSWRIVLLNAIGRPNGVVVHVVAYEDKKRGVRLAGTTQDVAIVKSLWAWLEAEAVRLSWGPLASLPKDKRPKRATRLSKFQTDWIIGFAFGVAEQLERELHKPDGTKSQAPASAALVLLDRRRDEAKTWLARLEDTKPLNALKGQKPDSLALSRGFQAGERYHLGKKLPKGDSA
jgi:hypothetical protein